MCVYPVTGRLPPGWRNANLSSSRSFMLATGTGKTAGASRDTWLLEMPVMPMALTKVVDRARRDAVHVGLLNDGRQRLLGGTPRLQEGREVAPFLSLGISRSTVPTRVSHARWR